ncbi:FAD-binding protein [Salinibacterium sp. SYSU T00001]|uniref:FAD-binding oxidoreductase n=1 Tax=Homoserinimonas sedimenticola TaxID=2986805 RepID=UPI002236BCBF|nr:FAD-linked oxidase C-terminal domain-containing protein [Salinibacterium sedimenticola]MCW4386247.1 FAD-binding protein [Salinibacterium sedimenticola]
MASLLDDLAEILPADQLRTGDAALAYDRDLSDGTGHGAPLAVALPTSTEQVAALVKAAGRHGAPIVPQGARTGLAGGANAVDGCLVLSLERMTRIVEVDVADQVATVEAGVLTFDLATAAEKVGLFYPPDPGSWQTSTIGGNVATNAGGMRCVKYGVTRDFVRGLTVVLASGDVVRTGRRTVKGVAGLDLTSLIVGSEGTLGIVTEVTVALRPRPAEPVGVLAAFSTRKAALAAADLMVASERRPSILEFLDRDSVAAISAFDPSAVLPADAEAVLLVQSDEPGRTTGDANEYAAISTFCGATTVEIGRDRAGVDALMQARRSLHGAMRAVSGASLNEDVSVPRSRLAELLDGIDEIAERMRMPIATAGHIGDGNLHPIVAFDPADATSVGLANETYQLVIGLAVSLGGTSSGEHGIGTLKRAHLEAELGPELRALQRAVKHAFDPEGLLNPGKKL